MAVVFSALLHSLLLYERCACTAGQHSSWRDVRRRVAGLLSTLFESTTRSSPRPALCVCASRAGVRACDVPSVPPNLPKRIAYSEGPRGPENLDLEYSQVQQCSYMRRSLPFFAFCSWLHVYAEGARMF